MIWRPGRAILAEMRGEPDRAWTIGELHDAAGVGFVRFGVTLALLCSCGVVRRTETADRRGEYRLVRP